MVYTDKMQDFQAVNKWINLSHESFHKNDFAQADAHVTKFCRKPLPKQIQLFNPLW